MTIRPQQLKTLLAATIAAGDPVLIKGKPGVGKTSIVEQATEANGADLLVSHPVTADPTDAKGLPWKVEGRDEATFLPYGDLNRAMKATKPLVWFLDDLGQASPTVQAAFMQLLLARRINGHALPDCVTFVAATNRREDRAGVQGILEPVKSRFVTIVELEANIDDWSEWAYDNDVDPRVIAFNRLRPDLLSSTWAASADIVNNATPRTWAHADKILKYGLDDELRAIALAGAIGEGATAEFLGFLRLQEKAPAIEEFLLHPDTAPLIDDPGVCYAVVSGLAYRCDTTTFAAIRTYAERMYAAGASGEHVGLAEFAVLLIRDCYKRHRAITQTRAYTELVTSPIGKAIFEALAQ